jgi:hypothetical protein
VSDRQCQPCQVVASRGVTGWRWLCQSAGIKAPSNACIRRDKPGAKVPVTARIRGTFPGRNRCLGAGTDRGCGGLSHRQLRGNREGPKRRLNLDGAVPRPYTATVRRRKLIPQHRTVVRRGTGPVTRRGRRNTALVRTRDSTATAERPSPVQRPSVPGRPPLAARSTQRAAGDGPGRARLPSDRAPRGGPGLLAGPGPFSPLFPTAPSPP